MKQSISSVDVRLGRLGIQSVYEESLRADAIDIICQSEKYATVIGDFFDRVYAPKLYGAGIHTREILPDTKGNRKSLEGKDIQIHAVRFLKRVKESESDLLLYGDRVAVISFNAESPSAVLFSDPEVISQFREIFTNLWERLIER
jgi:hypothetical protein